MLGTRLPRSVPEEFFGKMSAQFADRIAASLPGVLILGSLACFGGGDDAPTNTRDTTNTAEAATQAPIIDTVPAIEAVLRDATDPPSDSGPIEFLPVLDSLRQEIASLRAAIAAQLPGDIQTDIAASDSTPVTAGELVGLTGEQVRETADGLRYVGLRTLWALILLVFAWLLVRLSVWLLERFAERTAARRLFFKKLIPIVRLVIWSGIAYYIVTGVFQVDRSGLVAATAALGVGIGFAAQSVLKNFIGGLIVIFDQPFQVGDKIKVGGTYGEVVNIGMRSTRIITPDDNLVTVPNAQVVEEQVSNANAGALECQTVVDLYLPGWIDVSKAKALAFEAAANSKYVSLNKPIVVFVADEFKETFLTHLMVKSYVIDTRQEGALASDVTERAKTAFLQHGLLGSMTGLRGFPIPNSNTADKSP